jgi:hypothetical protein
VAEDQRVRRQPAVAGGRTERFVVKLTPEDADRLRELAQKRGVTVQRLISETLLQNEITPSRVVAQEVAGVRRLLAEDSANLAKMANSGKWDQSILDQARKGIEWRNQALHKYSGWGK